MIGDSPLELLSKRDVRIGQIINSVGSYSIERHKDSFESLIRSIIYQQLSGKAANAIYQRFMVYYDNSFPTPKKILATDPKILRSKVGLSNRKIEYIMDLSSKVLSGEINLENISQLEDEEVISQLSKVKGIGRWTAEMFLIFCLSREDVFPDSDLGIKRAIQRMYELPDIPTNEFIMKISSHWRPYRSIAAWYLWKSLNNYKK
jgi:DNA-3-methyladenine glycosylase II